MNFLKIIFFLLFTSFFSSQNLSFDTSDYKIREEFIASYKDKSKTFNKNLKKQYDKKQYDFIVNILTIYQQNIIEEVEKNFFLFDDKMLDFVNTKIKLILDNNPDINKNYNILIYKGNEPNAYNMAENTIVLNIGLFYYLSNEDEYMSVICHEIAHKELGHSINSIIYNQEELEKKNKMTQFTSKTSSYGREIAFGKLKNMLYTNMAQKRQEEIKADSLGLILFRNSKLQSSAYMHALERLNKLEKLDSDSVSIETYKKWFDIPNQKFEEKWLIREDFSNYNYKKLKLKVLEDSLKTHPNIETRIDYIRKKLSQDERNVDIKEASVEYNNLKSFATDRFLANFYDTENYGIGLYVTLIFLEKDNNNQQAKYYLGKFFSKVYEVRTLYTLNRYLDKIDPRKQNESYQQFLSFMWNLNINEIKNIADFYTTNN